MPAEVQRHCYLFLPKDGGNPSHGAPSVPPGVPPVFYYNPLHDMESLWWLAAYVIIGGTLHLRAKIPSDSSVKLSSRELEIELAADRERVRRQDSLARCLFDLGNAREITMTSMTVFTTDVQCLPPVIYKFGPGLDFVRQLLVAYYQIAERDLADMAPRLLNPKMYGQISSVFRQVHEAYQSPHDVEIRLVYP